MRLIIDIPEYLVREARNLIAEGRYSSLSSYILTSVENQLMLDKADVESGTVLVEAPQGSANAAQSFRTNRTLWSQGDYPAEHIVGYPEWEGRSERDWVWGQMNKLLPMKFATRVLANQVIRTKELPLLERFTKEAAAEARAIGLSLKRVDQAQHRGPGHKLSSGFPISDKIEKAEQRFRSQFIAYVKGDGRVSGALPELMFANVVEPGGGLAIGLTQAGVDFAALPNPVLDEGNLSHSLSQEEVHFYLDHIGRRVPWEASAFSLILSIIRDRINGRVEVNNAVKARLGVEWGPKEINTQRAGAMARMFDLGLLARERRGRSVQYTATERGMRWLEQTERTMSEG